MRVFFGEGCWYVSQHFEVEVRSPVEPFGLSMVPKSNFEKGFFKKNFIKCQPVVYLID